MKKKHMKKKQNHIKTIFILAISLLIIYCFILPREEYTGYCRIEGTYRNRYVRCYGDYSPRAKSRAEKQADYCNRSSDPVSGCTSTYR